MAHPSDSRPPAFLSVCIGYSTSTRHVRGARGRVVGRSLACPTTLRHSVSRCGRPGRQRAPGRWDLTWTGCGGRVHPSPLPLAPPHTPLTRRWAAMREAASHATRHHAVTSLRPVAHSRKPGLRGEWSEGRRCSWNQTRRAWMCIPHRRGRVNAGLHRALPGSTEAWSRTANRTD